MKITPRKKPIPDKSVSIVLGIALALSVIGVINLVSVSSVHGGEMHDGTMHRSMMQMMMGDVHDTAQEEADEMLRIMDKDSDGLCDHCGMSADACSDMMTLR